MRICNDKTPYAIGEAIVDPAVGEIRLRGRSNRVEPRLLSVLNHLALRRGQVVSRQELLDAVWRGDASGDESLTQAISALRRALGESARSPRYLQTIPKTGYRLIADVPSPASKGAAPSRSMLLTTMRQLPVRWPLYVAALIVLLATFGAFIAYDDLNPGWNINPNPDIEIEDIDLD
jgi:DNA-binding winged helix-turn-helix (wHTH) protein